MMLKARGSIERVPYCFFRSSLKFQGHTCWKIDDLIPIWVRLLGRSQLSNPSDLPCLYNLAWNGASIPRHNLHRLGKATNIPYWDNRYLTFCVFSKNMLQIRIVLLINALKSLLRTCRAFILGNKIWSMKHFTNSLQAKISTSATRVTPITGHMDP